MVRFFRFIAAIFVAILTTHVIVVLHGNYLFRHAHFKLTNSSKTARSDIKALNFDECLLRSNPTWTEEMRWILNSTFDPLENCDRTYRPWSSLGDDGRVTIRSEFAHAKCRARAVKFKDEFTNAPGEWHLLEDRFVFESDIVEVECKKGGKVAYSFLHSQIWTGEKSRAPTSAERKDKPPSVYIMLLDSIGASHARRVLPKTIQFLKQEFQSTEMLHVNKAGENSRPNAFAFLFGKTIKEVNRELFGLPNIAPDLNFTQYCTEYLDNKTFVIKDYEKHGYKTMMAEDWDKGVFNWPKCKGFKKPPTTHYMRPFQLALARGVGAEHQGAKNCFEPHHFLNDYTEHFMQAYPDSPKFGLNWDASVGHDSADEPFHTDVDYLEFFKRNREELDNSFLFFMADHGLRFGKMSETHDGHMDNNNPMMHISVPRRLRNNGILMRNLERNSVELLTSLDLHATFVDILETCTDSKPVDFSYTVKKEHLRGTSFLRPLPPGPRNCKTLPIPFAYCICSIETEPVPITWAHSGIGRVIADGINDQMRGVDVLTECAEVEPYEIYALKLVTGTSDLYDATVRLKPSKGLFQTFVRGTPGHFTMVSPDITRVDDYGNQANCIFNNEIRPLCYCRNFDPSVNSTVFIH